VATLRGKSVIVVVGLGYVGAVTAACLADLGHTVIGVDVDRQKVEEIEAGRSPIVEPQLEELVTEGRKTGRLRVTTDLAGALGTCDVVMVCVGTPARSDGTVNLEYVERVSAEIARELANSEKFVAVVYRSTVPPGTVDGQLRPVLERESSLRADHDFGVAMAPEFLREGSGVADFFEPPFIVAGVREDRTLGVVTELFAGLQRPTHALSIEQAESLKYACNAYHALKITFANEVGRLLGAVGVDARDVMQVFREDGRLNISTAYLRPGFAFGGSCLPKDMRALMHLARVHDVDVPVLTGILRSNESHLRLAVRRVLDAEAREVALLGLSFKPETDDLRESPYVELAETLVGKGIRLRIYDPIVNPERLIGANRRYIESHLPHLQEMLVSTPEAALREARAAVVGTSDAGTIRALVSARPDHVLDVHGGLGADAEALPGYEGIAW
jgi:GDP-mannose 6-dehydrogenase